MVRNHIFLHSTSILGPTLLAVGSDGRAGKAKNVKTVGPTSSLFFFAFSNMKYTQNSVISVPSPFAIICSSSNFGEFSQIGVNLPQFFSSIFSIKLQIMSTVPLIRVGYPAACHFVSYRRHQILVESLSELLYLWLSCFEKYGTRKLYCKNKMCDGIQYLYTVCRIRDFLLGSGFWIFLDRSVRFRTSIYGFSLISVSFNFSRQPVKAWSLVHW